MQFGFSRSSIALAVAVATFGSPVTLADNKQQKIEIIEVHGKVSDADMIIDQTDLTQLQANDLSDIFRSLPQVSVGGSNPVAQKIYVRGLEDTMLNVSIDGALQAGYLFHHQGRLSIEPELLKQVDVVAGAGDATSGSGALGGALRFKTKSASDLLAPDENFGALFKLGYYGNSEGFKASSTVYGRVTDDIDALVSLIKRDTENMEDGNGDEIPYSQSEQEVGFAKISGDITDTQSFSLSHDVRHDDGTRLLRAHWHPSRKNLPLPQESERTTNTLNYFYAPHDDLIDVAFSAYQTKNSITHAHPKGENRAGIVVQNTYFAEYDSQGFDIKNIALYNTHKIVAGFDYRDDEAILEDIGSNYELSGVEKGKVLGIYIQDYFQVTEQFQISTGVRYDNYELDDDNGHNFDSSGFSPNVNLTYELTPELSVNTGYAKAVRGQKVKELFVLGYYDNDVNLRKEVAENIEFGFKYLGDNLVVQADVFVSTIDDAVSTAKNLETQAAHILSNVGDLENKGLNINARYSFEKVSLSLAFNSSSPEWKTHINPALAGTPISDQDWSIGTSVGDTLTLGADYSLTDSIELAWQARLVKRLDDAGTYVWDNTQLPEKVGYGVHDLKATWYITDNENLKLDVAIKNVFDKFYYDHATYAALGPIDTGVAEPGRDIRATITWQL
ncbi:TonB-dependent receptor domain-containing protein [Pseudoalteromonas obscura]|uniref:TonB-dependent receptor n=1 Tax=Pseudoalteromonas obscura TaxID=3048491 RepID=A0ABT7EQ77_9GAMM|nr:TonB-dependent receptor [Pseudoalteromonas sp. P94(2023)]MDK2597221.1 TonB-dependent receptor [Pseudoalteromonas sp. P94(2023)]